MRGIVMVNKVSKAVKGEKPTRGKGKEKEVVVGG
jgi:hypothetical protein